VSDVISKVQLMVEVTKQRKYDSDLNQRQG